MIKRITSLIVLALLICSFTEPWQISCETNKAADGIGNDIVIKVIGSQGALTFSLFDGQPAQGGKKIQEFIAVSELQKTFVVNKSGIYFAGVTDVNGNCKYLQVIVK